VGGITRSVRSAIEDVGAVVFLEWLHVSSTAVTIMVVIGANGASDLINVRKVVGHFLFNALNAFIFDMDGCLMSVRTVFLNVSSDVVVATRASRSLWAVNISGGFTAVILVTKIIAFFLRVAVLRVVDLRTQNAGAIWLNTEVDGASGRNTDGGGAKRLNTEVDGAIWRQVVQTVILIGTGRQVVQTIILIGTVGVG